MMRTVTLAAMAMLATFAVAGCSGDSESPGTDLPFVLDTQDRRDAPADLTPSDPGTIHDDLSTDMPDVEPPDATPADDMATDETPVDSGSVDHGEQDQGTVDDGSYDPGPPPCDAGMEACLGSMSFLDGKTCDTALIVGRVALTSSSGYLGNPDLAKAGNNDDLPSSGYCRDPGPDLFWRVYMMEGEMLNIQLVHPSSSYQRLKVYRGTSCSKDPSTLVTCEETSRAYDNNRVITYAYTAVADDWVTIVVDTRDGDWEELKVVLDMRLFNCPDSNCCCLY